ncbi:glutathione S-transferase [Lecanosticta acicola]|uniref:Glutathione S-transferase n=1 Tax=Lecanosticta acicola TaxID=111012 RepID=A0AAI8Z8Z7_9PEZI|nr:glutathione S-transferase [Lecanosticta acicola]
MVLKLISATPSPYARINRIAMIEKGIQFELQSEIPWHKSETQTPKYNPLEKLPVLIFDDGRAPIYDSSHIQDYIVQKYSNQGPKLVTGDLDRDLQLKQVQVLSQGVMDAVVLKFFEKARAQKSHEWEDRQARKVDGGFRAFEELARNRQPQGSDYLFFDQFTIADIAVVCAVGFVNFNGAIENWQQKYPSLATYFSKLDEMESFKSTRPVMFDIKSDQVV